MMQRKIIVEKHPDAYVAYPLGLKGVAVGQGDTLRRPWRMSNLPSPSISKPSDRKSWKFNHAKSSLY
jgi:hypothetical protein